MSLWQYWGTGLEHCFFEGLWPSGFDHLPRFGKLTMTETLLNLCRIAKIALWFAQWFCFVFLFASLFLCGCIWSLASSLEWPCLRPGPDSSFPSW